MKVALHNLGCKVNAYETDFMQQIMQENGFEIVKFDAFADIYIINTCSVTNMAARKSRQMLHRAKAQNPAAIVVAVGCFVQTAHNEAENDSAIDICIGNNRKNEIFSIIKEYIEKLTVSTQTVIDIAKESSYEEMQLTKTALRTRADIKVQDGCNQFCAYCIIPYARGRVRSRELINIIQEAKGLVAAGYKEVVITGIHISSYGSDFLSESKEWSNPEAFLTMLEEIEKIEGLKRIRIGSFEPRIITEEFAKRLANNKKICPHFHLSLQSGSDTTLQRMNRKYNTKDYAKSVKIIRSFFNNPAITTDVIVGFPGETEEEFQETFEFLKIIHFYEMHIFKFSRRKGTVADKMVDQVLGTLKQTRSNQLLQLEKEQSMEFRNMYIGSTCEVLFEEERKIGEKMYQIGFTREYIKVACQGTLKLTNQVHFVEIIGSFEKELMYGNLSFPKG